MMQDMKTTLTKMFTVLVLMMISMAVGAEVKVQLNEVYTGGKVAVKSQEDKSDGSTLVTITVTPDKGYTITNSGSTWGLSPCDTERRGRKLLK